MQISERDRRALILGGAGIGVLILYFGIVEPVMGKYSRLVKEHDAAATRLARTLADQQRQTSQQEQVKEFEVKSGALTAPKLYAEGITSVGAQIVAAAQSSNVELSSATPGPAAAWAADSQFNQAIFQIDGKADWESVFKFVAALYKIEGVLSVEQMDLNPADPKQPGKLSMRIALSVLLKPEAGGGAQWLR